MPTNNVKHRMLVEAKRIANTEFKPLFIDMENEFGVITKIPISKEEIKNNQIDTILSNHPEFDPNTFRQMIKEIEIRNKQKEE